MDTERLRTAFDTATEDDEEVSVRDVEHNRGQVRVVFENPTISQGVVKQHVEDEFGADTVFGFSVTTENTDAYDGQSAVASFRYRPEN